MNHDQLTERLKNKLQTKEKHISSDNKQKIMQLFHNYYVLRNEPLQDIIIAIEEIGELTQVISKLLRQKMEPTDIAIAEEITDVKLCIYELAQNVFKMSTYDTKKLDAAWIDQKLMKSCIQETARNFSKVSNHDLYKTYEEREKHKTDSHIDVQSLYDISLKMLHTLSKLSLQLTKILTSDEPSKNEDSYKHTCNKIEKQIQHVNKSLVKLTKTYQIDMEVIRYIEDIKMERTENRIQNNNN